MIVKMFHNFNIYAILTNIILLFLKCSISELWCSKKDVNISTYAGSHKSITYIKHGP